MKYLIIGDPDFMGLGVAKVLKAKNSEFMFHDPSIEVGTSLSKIGETVTAETDNEYALKTTFSSFRPDIVFYVGTPVLTPKEYYVPLSDYSHFMRSMLALSSALDTYGAARLYLRSSYEIYGAVGSKSGRKKIKELDSPHPGSLRGAALAAAENLFRILCFNNGIEFTSLRYFEIIGPDPANNPSGLITGAVKSVLSGRTLILGKETRSIDFISSKDAFLATKAVVKSGITGPINIGTGYGTPVEKMFAAIKKHSGRENSVVHLEIVDLEQPNTKAEVLEYYAVANVSKLTAFFTPDKFLIDSISNIFDFYNSESDS